MQSFFIWNNRDCRSMGITLAGPAPIVRPEERVKHVEIPGVAGDLTEIEGENIYNSYIQTVSMTVTDHFNVRDVFEWLRGSGYVTFSGEPDRKQAARVIGAVTLNRISRNLDKWQGEVQFYCQPLKELLKETPVTLTASGTVKNTGDVAAKPLLKVTPSSTSCSVKIGDDTITVTGTTSGTAIWIDSETMEVWNSDRSATITKNSSGNFPVLQPGANTVTLTSVSSIEITKRERFL